MDITTISTKVINMMRQQMYASQANHFHEVLKALLNVFGGLYYTDGNGAMIRIKCSTGRPERTKGKDNRDNTLVLPYITVFERGSANIDEHRRYLPVLVNEVEWDEEELRAKRYLSLSPRPIAINYDINVWTKFSEDMDIIRSEILHLFNPDLEIRTNSNDYIKAFFESESQIESEEQPDTKDRILKKKISIKVETYLRSPRILFTNTSEIENMVYEVDIVREGCE